MAVPIEFCTAVFLKEQLTARFPGGLDALFEFCDSDTYLEDDHLVRLSFMATGDAVALVDRIADHVKADSAEPLVFAIVDQSVTPRNLPPWLSVGDVAGTPCAWVSGTQPGSIASVPKSFSARFFRIPFSSFVGRIARLGISVESSSPTAIEIAFHRDATRVDATVGVDDDGILFGISTFPPHSRTVDRTRHDGLLADLEATLRELGWNGSTWPRDNP
jgi:hypothetical protein